MEQQQPISTKPPRLSGFPRRGTGLHIFPFVFVFPKMLVSAGEADQIDLGGKKRQHLGHRVKEKNPGKNEFHFVDLCWACKSDGNKMPTDFFKLNCSFSVLYAV